MNILTDIQLRSHWFKTRCQEVVVEEGTFLTPAARDFLKDHGIVLRYTSAHQQEMPQTPIPQGGDGRPRYVDAITGQGLVEKPEHMTHLRGNQLVPKGHPRIALRGKLDSLEAKILEVQVVACQEGYPQVAHQLEELLACVRSVLAAEVKDVPLEEKPLLGMDSQTLRRVSHHVKEEIGIPHPTPSYQMGPLCVALNALRTQVREVELAAVQVFCQGEECSRPDFIRTLNRLSSCVYIIFCRKLAGYYGEGST